jgi:hypothetical protein
VFIASATSFPSVAGANADKAATDYMVQHHLFVFGSSTKPGLVIIFQTALKQQ